MHPRSVMAIARKDAIDLLLNKSALGVLLTPIILAVVFLFISKLVSGHTTNILVYNPGQSRLVQVVSGAFEPVKITETHSPVDVTAVFGANGSKRDAAYDVGLIIPANFEGALRTGSHPQVSLYVDESNIDPHQTLLLREAITNYARQVVNPQTPLALSTATINQPAITDIGVMLGNNYGAIVLLVSFMAGTALLPGLLIEEREKKTLRLLMAAPASYTDIVLGKVLVTFAYQVILSLVVLAIMGDFTGQAQAALLLLYTLVGTCFSLALGLLVGGLCSKASTAGMIGGLLCFIYVIPGLFTGLLGSLFGSNPVGQAMKFIPTYYIANGAYEAIQNQGALSEHLLNISVILGSTFILLAITGWILRRQAAIVATI
jgi:ABC-2 type transport system permease protein